MQKFGFRYSLLVLCFLQAFAIGASSLSDPKQTAANTVSIHIDPVKPQVFQPKVSFFINKIVDRSGAPQPLLAYPNRGGVFFDREPSQMVRQALEESFKLGDALAPDAGSADYALDIYIFQFGLASGSGFEFFAKVELSVVVKDNSGGKSEPVSALGTSIQNRAILKSNVQKNVTANVEEALHEATRNLLRGVKFRDSVASLQKPATTSQPVTTMPDQMNADSGRKALSKAEILGLLKGDTPSAQVAMLVKDRGITFTPSSNDLTDIRSAGGHDDLIQSLETSKPH
jgi:hypothetical protein